MTITYHLHEIDNVAKKIIENSASRLLLFYGNMGVGKTTLIKAIAKQLGINDATRSPSFSLVNVYGEDPKMYHFDFYRIKHETEAYDMGFEDYLASKAWICIEWPEKIPNLLPEKCTIVKLTIENDHRRTLTLKNQN